MDICSICKKPAIRYEQTLSRWFDRDNKEMVAHWDCIHLTEIFEDLHNLVNVLDSNENEQKHD